MKSVLALALLATLCAAKVSLRDGWEPVAPAPSTHLVTLMFALPQVNLTQLDAEFVAVNDPKSPRYGQFLTREEILDIVAPPAEVEGRVVDYLRARCGFDVLIEARRDAIHAKLPVKDVNAIFGADMTIFVHEERSQTHVASDYYAIPAELAGDVDFVAGIGGFPVPGANIVPTTDGSSAPDDDKTYIAPLSLYEIYNYSGYEASGASLCLCEFVDYTSYEPTALSFFQSQSGLADNPIPQSNIVGPFTPSEGALESQLDVQYGLASARGATGWYWTSENWIFTWSNNLFNHPSPPNVASISWGWSEDDQCMAGLGMCNISETSQQYVQRTDVELQKLGTLGITVVVCSQDEGAPGSTNSDCQEGPSPLNPIYPATSAYVLSVGATMLQDQYAETAETAGAADSTTSSPAICEGQYPCASSGVEIACSYPDALITSGGGFSNYISTQSWQSTAVNDYLSSGVYLPPSSYFNSGGRAVPDIAALGHNYLVAYDEGDYEVVDGTSCSTPVVAGIMTLINAQRAEASMAPLGFVNMLIYDIFASDDGSVFNDITIGNNNCTEACCLNTGYQCTTGWDAVTGVGTPNVGNLVAAAMAAGKPRRVLN